MGRRPCGQMGKATPRRAQRRVRRGSHVVADPRHAKKLYAREPGDLAVDFTQAQAGAVIGVAQPQVSLLMRNRSGSFSVERLMSFLTALGHDVEITVRPTRREHGEMSVVLG